MTQGFTNYDQASKVAGDIVQVQYTSITTPVDVTANPTLDDTAPLYSEGNAIANVSITPASASNILLIEGSIWGASSVNGSDFLMWLNDATGSDEALAVRFMETGSASHERAIHISHMMTAGTTSAITFYLMGAINPSGTFYVGRDGSGTDLFGAAAFGLLKATEIKV